MYSVYNTFFLRFFKKSVPFGTPCLSNYEQNTSFVGRPFNGIAIGGSLLNKIINKNDNNNSVNRQKINNTFEQLRIQNAKN